VNQILLGDCLDVLKTLPDESVHSVVTDPPYGLGTREPTADEIVAYLQGGELDHGGDFMGRDWNIPPVAVWQECFRVLKPGGHLLSFGGTRTFDLISIGIRAAGFECRDTIAQQFGVMCLEWIQGQGFPKSMNVRKALEKAGLSAEEAERWEGWGSALKPSWEPILVFRKPVNEGTVARQVLATGTGALNIDACRIRTSSDDPNHRPGVTATVHKTDSMFGVGGQRRGALPPGRWPANILLTHAPECKVTGVKRIPAPVINRFDDGMKPFGEAAGHRYTSEQTGDADGMEDVPVYECEPGCPVKALDGQSGVSRSLGGKSGGKFAGAVPYEGAFSGLNPGATAGGFGDTGGASRFFSQFEPDAPFVYSAKVSKAERDRGLSKGTNKHPTVKPLAVMQWLVRLVTPKCGAVLDPYCGSGTTCLAALEEGCCFIGIERDPESHHVAVLRTTREPDVFDTLEDLA